MKRLILGAAGLVWIAALSTGFFVLVAYANTPGAVVYAPPAQWPARTSLARMPGLPVLLMFLHPKCPCSRASLGELARLMAQAPTVKTTHVLFYKAQGTPADWHQTDLWVDASAIPGVAVAVDHDDLERRRFGVATSGHTFLYDSGGQLRFSGGITASRGYEGDNAGRSAVVSTLLQRPTERRTTPVFGCSLIDQSTGAGASWR